MKTIWVKLNSLDDVKRFARAAGERPLRIFADTGSVSIDARSLMALFCLDLRRPVRVRIDGAADEAEKFCSDIHDFLTFGTKAVMA